MASAVTLVRASGVYTFDADAEIANAETVVIGGKTYTFQTTLPNTDGNVKIGANRAATIANLVAAINLAGSGTSAAGTGYAAATTRNPAVFATAGTNAWTVTSFIPGTVGNLIPATAGTSDTTPPEGSVLAGGTGNVGTFIDGLFSLNQINSELLHALRGFAT